MQNMITFRLSDSSIKTMAEFAESQKSVIQTPGDEIFVIQLDVATGRGTIQSKRGEAAALTKG